MDRFDDTIVVMNEVFIFAVFGRAAALAAFIIDDLIVGPFNDGRKFLLEILSTYKSSPTPIDVKAVAESIRKKLTP